MSRWQGKPVLSPGTLDPGIQIPEAVLVAAVIAEGSSEGLVLVMRWLPGLKLVIVLYRRAIAGSGAAPSGRRGSDDSVAAHLRNQCK